MHDMTPLTSSRLSEVAASASIEMAAAIKGLQAAGQDIINLTWGEPEFPTPLVIRRAAQDAIESKPLGYTDSRGIPPLCQALGRFWAANHLPYDPERNPDHPWRETGDLLRLARLGSRRR